LRERRSLESARGEVGRLPAGHPIEHVVVDDDCHPEPQVSGTDEVLHADGCSAVTDEYDHLAPCIAHPRGYSRAEGNGTAVKAMDCMGSEALVDDPVTSDVGYQNYS
jgi:hypothetical protein